MFFEELPQSGAVQEPSGSAAVLDAHAPAGGESVEGGVVEVARDRLVVADAPDPVAGSFTQGGLERGRRANGRGSAVDRLERGGERQQVDVVVVQGGQQRSTGPLQDSFTVARVEPSPDAGHGLARDLDVGPLPGVLGPTRRDELDAADQHGKGCSTSAVSRPNGAAAPGAGRARGGVTSRSSTEAPGGIGASARIAAVTSRKDRSRR